jgi:hypothetical protein
LSTFARSASLITKDIEIISESLFLFLRVVLFYKFSLSKFIFGGYRLSSGYVSLTGSATNVAFSCEFCFFKFFYSRRVLSAGLSGARSSISVVRAFKAFS